MLSKSRRIPLTKKVVSYSYSNLGYALLGAFVEVRASRPFAEEMNAFPIQNETRDSTFLPQELEENAARGRVVNQAGQTSFNAPGWYASRYAAPFSGLWSTPSDMVHFGELLSAASLQQTHPWHAIVSSAALTGHGLGPVFRLRSGLQSIEHDGGSAGFLAWLVVVPERKVALSVMCNADGEAPAKANHFAEVIDQVLAVLLER